MAEDLKEPEKRCRECGEPMLTRYTAENCAKCAIEKHLKWKESWHREMDEIRQRNATAASGRMKELWKDPDFVEAVRAGRRKRKADGGEYSSPGRAYRSEQEYLNEQAMEEDWHAVLKMLQYQYSPPPRTLTLKKAKDLLAAVKAVFISEGGN